MEDINDIMPEDTVCDCMGVTKQDIMDAVAGGAADFDAVQEITGVSTGCGGCEEKARAIVADLVK